MKAECDVKEGEDCKIVNKSFWLIRAWLHFFYSKGNDVKPAKNR